ncbi:FkbM family methyltransferase [Ancylobacter sp. G4_0304]|uniref:FkbM family methyltransferase n=1 Tax=Ancylobacter sp. G4_0304 TaxID=3114289 RepID=UPI0039C6C6D8
MPPFKDIPKAASGDFVGRFREIVSDPLNLLIRREPAAGTVEDGHVCLHNGNRVAVRGPHSYYSAFSDILIFNRGVHEPLEEFVFQELMPRLPEAPIMIELGAYWAHYSMWLKRLHPAARVIMVEPESENLAAGQYNFATNGYEGEFIQAFVGSGHFDVDPFLDAQGLDRIDILHSDIQGYEAQMLKGARAALDARRVDYLFVSTHGQPVHQEVRAELDARGYRIEVASDDHETTSYDGFIFASSPEKPPVFDGFRPLTRNTINNMTPGELVAFVSSVHLAR